MKYEAPEMRIVMFETEDVVCAASGNPTVGGGDDEPEGEPVGGEMD